MEKAVSTCTLAHFRHRQESDIWSPEQRRTTLRKVEMDLDEADEMVCPC